MENELLDSIALPEARHLYIDEPAENWLDAGDKFIASNLYSTINSPKVLFTGRLYIA